MNRYIKVLISSIYLIILLISCSKEPKPIKYSTDKCSFCKMTIVDNKHAAQLVTSKGKNFNFDAIECMVHYMKDKNEKDYNYLLIADLLNPGNMLNAKEAVYIISENLPSPMGAFLSATKNREDAVKVVEENGGDIYDWEQLKGIIKK